MREHNLDIPLDATTLLATPKETKIQKVADGEYYHFGINNMLHLALKLFQISLKFLLESIKSLTMRINTDSIPLTNSTKTCLWPILALINEIPEIGVIIGVYHGTSKPTNLCDYQRWSPRGQILKSLALASKVKSLALASRPQVLENWPVLGSRTALFFGKLKFCGAVEKFFGKRFFVEIA